MEIDRAGADGAAAGQRNASLAQPRQQRAEHQEGRAHLAHDVVGRLGIGDGAAEGHDRAGRLVATRRNAVLGEERGHGLDIGEARHAGEQQPLLGQQTGGHERQGGVFRAADRDFAREGAAADDPDAIHWPAPYMRGRATPRCPMYLPVLVGIARLAAAPSPGERGTGRSPRRRRCAAGSGVVLLISIVTWPSHSGSSGVTFTMMPQRA